VFLSALVRGGCFVGGVGIPKLLRVPLLAPVTFFFLFCFFAPTFFSADKSVPYFKAGPPRFSRLLLSPIVMILNFPVYSFGDCKDFHLSPEVVY